LISSLGIYDAPVGMEWPSLYPPPPPPLIAMDSQGNLLVRTNNYINVFG
jgi:hypothetical protein